MDAAALERLLDAVCAAAGATRETVLVRVREAFGVGDERPVHMAKGGRNGVMFLARRRAQPDPLEAPAPVVACPEGVTPMCGAAADGQLVTDGYSHVTCPACLDGVHQAMERERSSFDADRILVNEVQGL